MKRLFPFMALCVTASVLVVGCSGAGQNIASGGVTGGTPSPPSANASCASISSATTICGVPPPVASTPTAPTTSTSPSASVAAPSCQGSASSSASGGNGGGGGVPYNGGPVIGCANIVVICINAPCSTYAVDNSLTSTNVTPCDFWNNLDASPMMHITDEYVGQTMNNRYVCTNSIEVDGVPTGPLGSSDSNGSRDDTLMLNIITANLNGSGLNAVYNLFMTPAQMNMGNACGYHSSAQVSTGGQQVQIIYAADAGCPGNVGPEDVINHETFEAITDPNAVGDGWIQTGRNGAETADLCTSGNHGTTTLNGTTYTMQPIWSNAQNACAYASP